MLKGWALKIRTPSKYSISRNHIEFIYTDLSKWTDQYNMFTMNDLDRSVQLRSRLDHRTILFS